MSLSHQYRYSLRAYWPSREETLEQCAEQIVDFVKQIERTDRNLAAWRKKGRSRKEALASPRQRLTDREVVLSLLGQSVRDGSESNIGYNLAMWDLSDSPVSERTLVIGCGKRSPHLGNYLLCDFVTAVEINVEYAKGIVVGAATAFWPEWAGVFTKDYLATCAFSALQPRLQIATFVKSKDSLDLSKAVVVDVNGLGFLAVPSGNEQGRNHG